MPNIIFELKRKFIHLFSLLFIAIYVLILNNFNKQIALLSLLGLLILFLVIEYFRLVKKKKIFFIHIFFREFEKEKLAGYIYFILGAIIAFAVFDFKIAIAALLMTTFGDMAAALFGIKFGKKWLKKIPNTAWEGILAELAVNIIIGFIFLQNPIIILAMALTATYVETVFTQADDNLIIPVFAGFIGQVLLMTL